MSASPTAKTTRIGVLGAGFVGSALCEWIDQQAGLELAFTWNRDPARIADAFAAKRLEQLGELEEREPDLVVEAAHPSLSQAFGPAILRICDYLPLSVTALADDGLRRTMLESARLAGHRLLLPHGALVGLDSLLEWRDQWASVTVRFFKHPDNIDFRDADIEVDQITGPTLLYKGPARGIAALFPRNVNTMITCALATLGLDETQCEFTADPSLDKAVAEVEAIGKDGATLLTRREQPASGVSGTEMVASTLRSLVHATSSHQTMDFL